MMNVEDAGWELRFFSNRSIKHLLSADRSLSFDNREDALEQERERNKYTKNGKWVAVHLGRKVRGEMNKNRAIAHLNSDEPLSVN